MRRPTSGFELTPGVDQLTTRQNSLGPGRSCLDVQVIRVAAATIRAWHTLKSTGVGTEALTRVMAVEWVPMQYRSEPGKSATDLWQSLVGGQRESDEHGAAAMRTEAPPDPLGSRIKPDMVKLDAFLSHPTDCGAVFDSRQTFWGELYEQQGFSRLRRYVRSGA